MTLDKNQSIGKINVGIDMRFCLTESGSKLLAERLDLPFVQEEQWHLLMKLHLF